MKKCPECGNPSYDGAPACGNCGYKFPKMKPSAPKKEIFDKAPEKKKKQPRECEKNCLFLPVAHRKDIFSFSAKSAIMGAYVEMEKRHGWDGAEKQHEEDQNDLYRSGRHPADE